MEKPCQDHPDQADQHQENCQHAEQNQDVPVEEGEGDVPGGVGGGGVGALAVQGDPHLAQGEASVVETHAEILRRCGAAHNRLSVSHTRARDGVKWLVGGMQR